MGWGLANVNVVVDPSAMADAPNVGEYGWDGTAGTIFWIDPKEQTVIVLMTQSCRRIRPHCANGSRRW